MLRDDIVSDISRGGLEITSGPKASSLVTLAQLRELHLDPSRRAAFDALHDVGQGQLWRYRQEHMHMISAQHTLHDMDPHFCASLHDNFTDPFTHWTLQNLAAIFCDPHDVKSVVKSRVHSWWITRDLLSWILKPYRQSGFQNLREKINYRFAESDRLEAGGFNPLGGK